MDHSKAISNMAKQFTNSQELEQWATTFGLSEDPTIKQYILDLKWRELKIELSLPSLFSQEPLDLGKTLFMFIATML